MPTKGIGILAAELSSGVGSCSGSFPSPLVTKELGVAEFPWMFSEPELPGVLPSFEPLLKNTLLVAESLEEVLWDPGDVCDVALVEDCTSLWAGGTSNSIC